MSIYGHYEKQYWGKSISYSENSFTISGISKFQNNLPKDETTELTMIFEPSNVYDNTAIAIYNGDLQIGYVPKEYKELCKDLTNEPLKIIHKKNIKGIWGIRVIPNKFYTKYWDTNEA